MLESWVRLGDAPFARVNHQSIFLHGSLYVFGGFNSQLRDINYSSHQLDVFKWNVQQNKWEELKYPLRLKAWDCNSKTWTSDPLSSADGSINPTLRFGHTVVAWRGRGWLFGGRTQQHVCPNQLYMFEPGYYNSRSTKESTAGPAICEKPHTTTVDIVHPCWVEVVGTTGTAPSPRDGHAATVLENAMFIFGGFEDVFGSYDNFVYRFDFITWSWTRIQIHQQPTSGLFISTSGSSGPSISHGVPVSEDGSDPNFLLSPAAAPQLADLVDEDVDLEEPEAPTNLIIQTDVPLPRDFSCLISHQGRLFLFGGRSELSARSGYDVYDSALWELVPLRVNESVLDTEAEQANTGLDGASMNYCYTPVWPDQCEYCSPDRLHGWAAHGSLQRMAWEEETGNWTSPEYWATAPPRPCCLWRYSDSTRHKEDQSTRDQPELGRASRLGSSPFKTGCRSRWCSGNATWLRRHPGHGLQLPDQLLPRLSQPTTNSRLIVTSSPHGRRSLSHWAYGGYLYIAFGTVRCQTGEQWQLHYHDVWRFSLAENTWTQIAVDHVLSGDPLSKVHWPSARRRAVANLYIPCPRVSPGLLRPRHVPTLFRPVVYVFGGTQPRVLDRRNTASGGSICQRFSMAAPARPYTLFTSGITHVNSPGEPVTQNQLLGLGDGDSVSLLHFPHTSSSFSVPFSSCQTITSPMAILLVNSPRTFHAEQSTPFYLVMIVPSCLPSSTMFFGSGAIAQPCAHQSALSHLCVVSFAELAALFRAPGSDCSAAPLPTLGSMCYGALDKLLYTSEPDWDTTAEEGDDDPQRNHHAQLYTALRVAWFAVLNRSQSPDAVGSSCADAIGGSRLHMMIVQQQQQPDATRGEDASCQQRGATGDSLGELSCTPLILEQHSYILAPDGQVFRESLDCVQGFLWFMLLPLVCSALITTVDLLLESTRRLLACLRQGNLRSFVLGPLVFRSSAPCPDCSSTGNSRPVYVWIDSSQLSGLVPVREPVETNAGSGRQSGGRASREFRHQTIASLLIQFLPHLRSTLELEFATQHTSGDSSATAPSGSQQEPTPSTSSSGLMTVISNNPSCSTEQTVSQTLLSDTCATRTENINNSVSVACGIVEPTFPPTATDRSMPTSPPSTDDTVMLIDGSPPAPLPSVAINPQPVERHRLGPVSEDSSDSDGLEEFFDQFFAGDEEPVSSDSDDATTGGDAVVLINPIGALVRGKERLMELADCYAMHLDTTLYDLCLRRLRGLGPSRIALLTLPSKILNDLRCLYYNPFGPEVPGRKSNSG